MLEPPDFSNERIASILRDDYSIVARDVEFLPIGYDTASSVYRAKTDSATYFLKLREGPTNEAALIVPHVLRERGIEQVIAPLPTQSGDLCVRADEFALILYPFVDGATAMERGMSEAQWVEFGSVLRRIHETPLTPDLLRLVERETFSARGGRERIRQLQAQIEMLADTDAIAREMAAIWREKRDAITRVVNRADELARLVQARALDFVLCHTDIHVANVLIDNDGRLFVVDWDQPLIAPKERDLMYVVGSAGVVAVSRENEAHFLRGYGATAIDPVAFAYYRYDWVVQDASEFGASGFGLEGHGDETRLDAVRMMRGMFAPGDAFDAAYRADF